MDSGLIYEVGLWLRSFTKKAPFVSRFSCLLYSCYTSDWVNEFTRWYTKPAEARLKRQCVSTHFVYQSGVLTLGVLCVT